MHFTPESTLLKLHRVFMSKMLQFKSMNTLNQEALDLHKQNKGKWAMNSKVEITSKSDLSLAYSPGVASPCLEIERDPLLSYEYTNRANIVAIISNGTAVLGLGDIGPLAAQPVMEGKAILFKKFADIDAIPLVIDEKDPQKLISIITSLAPSFGGINLEDIKAPECFIVEEALQNLGIPVVHDDQHGTAIVVLAGLLNALKVVNKSETPIKIVIVGAGAAGHAIAELLYKARVTTTTMEGIIIDDILVCDSKGIVSTKRDNLDSEKTKLLTISNKADVSGTIDDAMKGADVVIGVSQPNAFTAAHIKTMKQDAIVFALANPTPEVMPEEAKQAGAVVVATGRSDFPNQVNNVLAFPGLFRGLLDSRKTHLTIDSELAASKAIAELVENPTSENILPDIFDERVVKAVSEAVKNS